MTPIELLAAQSQEQHARYHSLYGTSPVSGDGLRAIATQAAALADQIAEHRATVIASRFSTEVTG